MTHHRGTVVWITGLSCVGKTTVATIVTEWLRQKGKSVLHLDGDQIRRTLPPAALGYCRVKRLALAHHYSGLARIISDQNHVVIVSTVSLFQEVHSKNRETFERYIEVLLEAPMDVLLARDTRQIYASFEPVQGVDIENESPIGSDVLRLNNFGKFSANATAAAIISEMNFRGI